MPEKAMEQTKPSSIKVIGFLIILFSAFMIFSNAMGILMNWAMESESGATEMNTENQDPISFIFDHFALFGLLMLSIGVSFLIGGVYIRKYRLWANKLVTYLSSLIVSIIWSLMITMAFVLSKIDGANIWVMGPILNALFWSAPMILLIWFLNKKNIRTHFA